MTARFHYNGWFLIPSFCIFFLFGNTFISSSAQCRNAEPSTLEIVKKVLAVQKNKYENKEKFTYKQLINEETLDDKGQVEQALRRIYELIWIGDERYFRLTHIDGKSISGDEKEKENKREKEFREQLKSKKKEKKDDFFTEKLANRFVYERKPDENVQNRPSYVIAFRPNYSKQLPENSNEDQFLNACAGTVWIDKQDFEIARIQARLIKDIRVGLGFVAVFQRIELYLEQKKTRFGSWTVSYNKLYLWGRTMLFKPIRKRIKTTVIDYKKAV